MTWRNGNMMNEDFEGTRKRSKSKAWDFGKQARSCQGSLGEGYSARQSWGAKKTSRQDKRKQFSVACLSQILKQENSHWIWLFLWGLGRALFFLWAHQLAAGQLPIFCGTKSPRLCRRKSFSSFNCTNSTEDLPSFPQKALIINRGGSLKVFPKEGWGTV